MPYTGRRPGAWLVSGLVLTIAAALAPAGLRGSEVPALSWVTWGVVLVASATWLRAAGWPFGAAIRRLAWLLPLVALLALPAGLLVPSDRRGLLLAALGLRALSAAAAGSAMAAFLGPAGLVRAVRQLRLPARLCDILAAMLASLVVILRQTGAMLRAREARRPSPGPWSSVVTAPAQTARGFGRLVASLLLRSLERAEAIELARVARGGGAR